MSPNVGAQFVSRKPKPSSRRPPTPRGPRLSRLAGQSRFEAADVSGASFTLDQSSPAPEASHFVFQAA
jgi:hypothetical protein